MEIHQIAEPGDPRLTGVADLLAGVFADPDTVLGLDRLRDFLAADPRRAGRQFFVLAASADGTVHGATIFSYVARSNCGFSEYLVVQRDVRGRGLGRRLFDARQARLDLAAAEAGYARAHGLFIEVDSPCRTPPHLLAAERETAIDARERLIIFDHFGFRRLAVAYVQPPLAPGKASVSYLDLLFRPADERASVPSAWLRATLRPIWRAWAPDGRHSLPRLPAQVGLTRLSG